MTQWGCVKLHDIKDTFCNAFEMCSSEGGRLISTDSFTTTTKDDYNALCLSNIFTYIYKPCIIDIICVYRLVFQ